jgi:hypothetical protein
MRSTFASLVAVALLSACGGSSKKEEKPTPWIVDCKAGSATVSGTFLTPSGNTPIVGATITLASAPGCTGSTSGTGAFELVNVPATPTDVTAVKVTPGTPAQIVLDAASISITYVPGDYDAIESVVTRLGFTATSIAASALASTDLSQYDILLLNCGLDESFIDDVPTLTKLRTWIEAGGVLYASDWAAIYVYALYPDEVNYLGVDDPTDWAAGAPYDGQDGEATADVLDETLARALGKSTALINFDLPGWIVIDSVKPGVSLLIRGPATTYTHGTLANRPFAAQFEKGLGRVTYTSFHEEAQTTVDMDTLLEQMLLGL